MKKDKNKRVETIVLDRESANKLLNIIENPPEPTKELKELISDSENFSE